MVLHSVQKRDGKIVPFISVKIHQVLEKAFKATKTADGHLVFQLTHEVVERLHHKFNQTIPHVEDIQDTVEEVLLHHSFMDVLTAFVAYREQHRMKRKTESSRLLLTPNAMKVLQQRYLLRDREGKIIETPDQLFYRVAKAIARVDKFYKEDALASESTFYQMMRNLEFLPNSPTLMNAGAHPELGLAACYVLPIEDSLSDIFSAVKYQALIQQGAGGTGFSFSKLRPKGDLVGTTKGVASGPVSFMRIFDLTTDVIKQGGKRRGANMAVLRVDHPDILEFISCKSTGAFSNFNISVGVTDTFMHAVLHNTSYHLVHPQTTKVVNTLPARDVWKVLLQQAWKTGDPGLLFLDEINRHHVLPELGSIEATNPCGEQPLLPFESCTLGSINLTKFVVDGQIVWDRLGKTVEDAVHFLDNVLDANLFPLPEIATMTKANRRIGLGVMGWAEFLILLSYRYDSAEAVHLGERLMRFIEERALLTSQRLGKKRGNFKNFVRSSLRFRYPHMRNVTVTTIAPTGTISIIAGCSSGIEPLFGISYVREVLQGMHLPETNSFFEKIAKDRGFYRAALLEKIARIGTVQRFQEIPQDVRRVFVTAHDITPEWHVRMQSAFQKYTDNAVSKTVNLSHSATVKDVERAYLLAYQLKCKGITVYRDGSKGKQVLYLGKQLIDAEFAGGCPGTSCGI